MSEANPREGTVGADFGELRASPSQIHGLLQAMVAVASDLSTEGVLHHITEVACNLVNARYGALGVLEGTSLEQLVTVGLTDEEIARIGPLPVGRGVVGALIRHREPMRLDDLTTSPESCGFPPNHPVMRTFLGVPIKVRGEVIGNLYLTEKQRGERFTSEDEALVVALAAAAGVAIENSRLFERSERLALLEERDRIARDLHDVVIQRLFATGMTLEALRATAATAEVRERIATAVDELDDTIRDIRSTIFALQHGDRGAGLRGELVTIANRAAVGLGFPPRVRFRGEIDTRVGVDVADDVCAVVQEALSNVTRHARATAVEVSVEVGDDDLHVTVADDGRGLPAVLSRRSGLQNLADRARARRGRLTIGERCGGGTELDWSVPSR